MLFIVIDYYFIQSPKQNISNGSHLLWLVFDDYIYWITFMCFTNVYILTE